MKSSSKKDNDKKKKYVFFSDPDIIVQRAETSVTTAKALEQQQAIAKQISKDKSSGLPIEFDLKNLGNYHPVQPFPFTFISAVKRKFTTDDGSEASKKTNGQNDKKVTVLKPNSEQNLHEIVQKMDFIRPLKVPDLKISAKKLDFSDRENSTSKELISPQFETPSKDLIHDRSDKPTKSFERVQRRLDFSTSDVSSVNNSEVEPLKVPNISISSNLSRKKEYIRESSREKENRSKRIRKDESLFHKQNEATQDCFKRSRSPRHVSRKDFSMDISKSTPVTNIKGDRLPFHVPRESDFAPTKPKTKNFATSTVRKTSDKRHRSSNTRSLKSRDVSLGSKERSCSNESLSDYSSKLSDKVTIRESRNLFEHFDYRYDDDLHMLKQANEQKHMFSLENRQSKQHKTCQPQTKKPSEKQKPMNKVDNKIYIINSKKSEDIDSVTDSNASVRTESTVSTQQTKNKDSEKGSQSSKSNKGEDSQCAAKKEEESFTQSTTTKQTNNESNLNDSILSDKLLDSRRISFRDESRSQEEFCNLITPDMNLIPRSKRKRQFIQNSNIEADSKCSKHNAGKIEAEEGIPLVHPTALHMQFQAELHLLDSFNESLRQVIDVEKCLYNVKQDQEKKLPLQSSEQMKLHFPKDERSVDEMEHCNETKSHKNVSTDKVFPSTYHTTSQTMTEEFENFNKISKPMVKAVEVQTQTVNDMATQTEICSSRRNVQSRCSEICGIPYERVFVGDSEVPQLSLDSVEQFEDLDQIEEISLPSKLRTMSEISLHETTSSIRTETGTEISISTRDVTCSFNKYLDLEIAQLIKDEKQRYDKIEMLFKSREKTLNDQTKKLVKLEEQKRALKDTGQDSRVSSVKKKQRALLLKLQQEKDEMNRLKELHKIASQERKLMLQKQRNMFNPQMSTKNILTKLKRSADSQSPRRLSGPMKGYDIRSNSSMSSLVDSDKSQHDRSQTDVRMQMSENELHFSKLNLPKSNKFANFIEEPGTPPFLRFDKSNEASLSQEKSPYKMQKDGSKSDYEIKSRKFEEKMPRGDILRQKSHQHSSDTLMSPGRYLFEKNKSDVSELLQQNSDKSEQAKSESDTLIEELSKKSKASQMIDNHFQISPRERESLKTVATSSETVPEELSSLIQDTMSKSSQVSENILQTYSRGSKKSSKSIPTDMSKKTQYSSESKSNFKRKSSKCQKGKSSIVMEHILGSKSNSQISEELIKHHNKRTKMENEFKNGENVLSENQSSRHSKKDSFKLSEGKEKDVEYEHSRKSEQSLDNVSLRSQISNFAISHHSSESDRNYSKSVVIRSQDHNLKTSRKLEQILNAREAALTSRKNCVEEWMAWHAKLRAEEDRVARMEQAALKLVTATSNVFSQQDTTVSSDTSDVEGRIELLTEKLAERRIEMSRLKREARKQTKQKLRALEANLLNQIKKYDSTISEMRRKLESKKGSKDTDKLAIESKSLADFKVPEIPLKKIQDMFKNNDLLRSRSESDLLSTRSSRAKNLSLLRSDVESESKRSKAYDERIEVDKVASASMSSISDDVRSEKDSPLYANEIQKVRGKEKSNSTEEVKTEISGTKSEVKQSENEATIQSDLQEYKSDFDTVSEQSKGRTVSSQSPSNKLESNVPSNRSNVQSIDAEINTESANEILDFSKKLDYLRLNNQNLHEDISSLENELRILSEKMSRFAKKPIEESQIEERSTSKDVSEMLSKSDFMKEEATLERKEINSEAQLQSVTNVSNKSIEEEVDNAMSAVISQDEISLSKSNQEIDYKARSKEILNEIEKSIISEHIKISENSDNLDVQETNRIYSNTAQDEESVHSIEFEDTEENLDNSESSLELNKNSLTTLDESNLIEKEGVAIQIQFENNNEITSVKPVSNINQVSVCESELSKEISQHSSNAIEAVENLENLKNYTKDKQQSLNGVHLVSTQDSFDLVSENKELDNQNEDVDLIESLIKHDTSDHAVSFNNKNEGLMKPISANEESVKKSDWIISDSFDIQQDTTPSWKKSFLNSKDVSHLIENSQDRRENIFSEIEDVPLFRTKSESTNTDQYESFNEILSFRSERGDSKVDNILDIISSDSQEETSNSIESEDFQKAIHDSVVKILDKVEKSIESSVIKEKIESCSNVVEIKGDVIEDQVKSLSSDSNLKDALQNENEKELSESEGTVSSVNEDETVDKVTINVNLQPEVTKCEDINDSEDKSREIIITELELDSAKSESLSELEVDGKVELPEEEYIETNEVESEERVIEEKYLEPIIEQDSSDGEQLDNLVEVAESGLDVIEKDSMESHDRSDSQSIQEKNAVTVDEIKMDTSNSPNNAMNKTFDILKDPEYEDISEESLEVSEIFDKSELQKSATVQKSSIPERYDVIHKSEEVLKILDEITQKSLSNSEKFQDDKLVSEDSEKTISDKDVPLQVVDDVQKKVASAELTISSNNVEEKDVLSESSEGIDTPKGVSEIEMDSPRDPNDSRLDFDALNDDLLSNNNAENQNDSKNTYHATPIVATSEKDIEVMIDKLKASLEQPGVEVADWEAKLLRIEQLQIELEIKKLEAEEVSYYVREIPNKPPPPYTPPGGVGRVSTSLGSPSPPPAVIPSNIDELTAFTEKATAIIFKAKEAGEDILRLEAPLEICELTKENDETVKKDRRIYNTFLFDLCKETIAEVYQAEYEKPGPSWTKPNVKTKPIMKIPKTLEELNAYVNKEVATLFGFKTKLQRENMVMRWSRKRRDRVDELLAREAQAEEDEWTKFHHDELAVKNGLTVTILDTLIMETVNVVKVAYAKKRKVMV